MVVSYGYVETVEGNVFDCFQATNRQFPVTVTGAYLSGIREAEKIVTASAETHRTDTREDMSVDDAS